MSEGRSVVVGPSELDEDVGRGEGRGSGFTVGRFNELRLFPDVEATVIFIRGSYQNRMFNARTGVVEQRKNPYYRYQRHPIPPVFQTPAYRAENTNERTGKTRWAYLVCTKGVDPLQPQPCIPCELGAKQTLARQRTVFSVLHLHPYHIMKKRDSEETYLKLCLSDVAEIQCNGCKEGVPKTDAATRYIEFTDTDYEALREYDKYLSGRCACGGQLGTATVLCSRCGTPLLQYSEQAKADFVKAIKEERYHCYRCGFTVPISQAKACSNNCQDGPKPLSIFNTVLTIKKTKPAGKSYTQVMVLNATPAGELLTRHARLLVPLDLEATFVGKISEQRAVVYKPYELAAPPTSESRR